MTMLTATDAAQALGVSKRHLYALAAKGLVPCYRFGSAVRFDAADLEPTPGNIKYAERLRTEILGKIERGTFALAEYFPDSPRSKADGAGTASAGLPG